MVSEVTLYLLTSLILHAYKSKLGSSTDTPLMLPCPVVGGILNFHKAKGEDSINCISNKNKVEGIP